MEALYKMKKPKTGQSDRDVRAKIKDTASKKSRANLLDSKRRIPLSEVQPTSNNKVTGATEKEEKPSKSRYEQLQEWKKQREAAKTKLKDSKNPPFRPCGSKKFPLTVRKSPIAKPLPASKKTTTCSSVTSKQTSNVACNKNCKVVPPARSSARLAAKKQAVPSTVRNTAKPREPQPSTSRQKSTRPHTQPTSTGACKKPASTKPPITRGRKTVADEKGSHAGKKVTTAKSVNEKRTTKATTSKAPSTRSSDRVSKGKATKSKPSDLKKEVPVQIADDVDQEDGMPAEPPTPTKRSYVPVHPSPLLKRRVAPVRRETVFMPQFVNDPAWIPGAVHETEALPAILNFDDAFEKASFSPFRFTATQSNDVYFSPEVQPQQPQFVFQPLPQLEYDDDITGKTGSSSASKKGRRSAKKRSRSSKRYSMRLEVPNALVVDCGDGSSDDNKDYVHSSENQEEILTSGNDGDVDNSCSSYGGEVQEEVEHPPATKRRRSSKRHSMRSTVIAPLSSDSTGDSEGGTSTSESTSAEGSQEEEPMSGNMETIDFEHFHGLYAKVTEDFTKLCHEWEEKSNKLEEEYSSNQSDEDDIKIEDVLGQIRTTVCQAQLLMRKKLKQYIQLVEEAQDPSVEKRANSDDLQSFWDMVYFQVEDVQKKFDAILILEKNGWKEKAPTPAKKKAKKHKTGTNKAGSSVSSSQSSERIQAARDKRAAQRNRLKEMKLAAKRAREQESEVAEEPQTTQDQEEPLVVSPAPKKCKTVHTPKEGSAGRERRRSHRIASRSVFSPIASSKPISCVNEVPTGCLVSFSPMK